MPHISLATLIKFLKKHYEELGHLFSMVSNYEVLDAITKMQLRIQTLIENLERLERGYLIDDTD